jgi:hypothetical protein
MRFRKTAATAFGGLFAATAILLAAACGGGDDDGGSGGSRGAGNDERYVADICKAGKAFQEDFFAALAGVGSSQDPNKVVEALAKPLEEFAKAFDRANPPSDLKTWHEQTAKQLKDVVKQFKDSDNLDDLGEAFDEDLISSPPAGAAERLQRIAESNKDCQDAGFNFDEDF